MGDKWVIDSDTLTGIANAVRTKKGTSGAIEVSDLASEVASIPTGTELPIKLNATWKNDDSASAYGEIFLTANDNSYDGNYDICWANENGVMDNYDAITTLSIDVDDGKVMDSIKLMEYNAIPKYATKIVAVQSNEVVASYDIPSFKTWNATLYGEHLYSFGAISDVHIQYDTGTGDVQTCLTYLNERESVDAICISGDLTSNGTSANLEEWKTARDTYADDTPVYSCVGNHEAYNGSAIMYNNPTGIRKYLDTDWTNETEPYFYKVINDDVFVFMSAWYSTTASETHTMFNATELAWLESILETYRNQRVFLFCHVPPHWNTDGIKYNGFGNGNGAYAFDIWGNPQVSNKPASDRTAFLNLLDHYKNVIWFSGHSHIKYKYQQLWDNLNVMQYKGGARFVHVSSLTVPRDIISGAVSDYIYAESEGAVIDVYENVIRMRCRNFVSGKFYGLCEYIIDTTPVTIPSKTKTVTSITASKTKVSYYTDEQLSTSDISVVATYSDTSSSDVSSSAVFDTSNVDLTTEGTYTIGISYTYGEDTVTTSVQVTASVRPSVKTLSSIVATKTVTSFVVGDSLTTNDISVEAYYSDNTHSDCTASAQFDTSNVDMSTAGAYTIGVSYTEDGVTETTTVTVTVSSASVNPTVIIDATWTGSITAKSQTLNATTVTTGNAVSSGASVSAYGVTGKKLWYKWITKVGVSQSDKVGLIGGVNSGNNVFNGDEFSDYTLTATDWTPITSSNSGSQLEFDNTNKYINVKFKSSSSSTATFPVSVNARLQIGYTD